MICFVLLTGGDRIRSGRLTQPGQLGGCVVGLRWTLPDNLVRASAMEGDLAYDACSCAIILVNCRQRNAYGRTLCASASEVAEDGLAGVSTPLLPLIAAHKAMTTALHILYLAHRQNKAGVGVHSVVRRSGKSLHVRELLELLEHVIYAGLPKALEAYIEIEITGKEWLDIVLIHRCTIHVRFLLDELRQVGSRLAEQQILRNGEHVVTVQAKDAGIPGPLMGQRAANIVKVGQRVSSWDDDVDMAVVSDPGQHTFRSMHVCIGVYLEDRAGYVVDLLAVKKSKGGRPLVLLPHQFVDLAENRLAVFARVPLDEQAVRHFGAGSAAADLHNLEGVGVLRYAPNMTEWQPGTLTEGVADISISAIEHESAKEVHCAVEWFDGDTVRGRSCCDILRSHNTLFAADIGHDDVANLYLGTPCCRAADGGASVEHAIRVKGRDHCLASATRGGIDRGEFHQTSRPVGLVVTRSGRVNATRHTEGFEHQTKVGHLNVTVVNVSKDGKRVAVKKCRDDVLLSVTTAGGADGWGGESR